MGTSIYAPSEKPDDACYINAADLTARASTNRALLSYVLSSAGVTNYGTWWHWSYGDWYWALRTQQPAALYGPVDMP